MVVSPVSPVVNFAAELASPDQRSRKTIRAYLLYRALEHGGKSRHLDQRRL